MNSNPHNPKISDSASHGPSGAGDETMRLIARLPAPAGLEDRVHTALRVPPRRARVLAWPNRLNPQNGWMRTAAAAAIVFVVVGGGWGVYSRVQRNQPAKIIAMPAHMPAAGGFSTAGAMRTPQTLPGPVAPQQTEAIPAQPRKNKKRVASAKSVSSLAHPAASKPSAQGGQDK
jgi:hypothetical protein